MRSANCKSSFVLTPSYGSSPISAGRLLANSMIYTYTKPINMVCEKNFCFATAEVIFPIPEEETTFL